MIHQELQLTNTIYRFELTTNSSIKAYEKAFSLYGILVIPALLGITLMYNVFQLRDEYFVIPVLILMLALVNIYVFYQRMTTKNDRLKLIIEDNQIQLMDNEKIYFQEQIVLTTIQLIRCGKNLEPALELNSKNFQGVIIGLRNIKIDIPIETQNQLYQPDYWLSSKHQAQTFMQLIGIEQRI